MIRIRIGFLDPFPPFCFTGPDGAARGRFLDLLRARAAAVGAEPVFAPGRLEDLPEALAGDRIEAIAAKALTPERAGRFSFSVPLLTTAAALFGPSGTAPPAIAAAGACRIATPREGPLAGHVARDAPSATLVGARDYADALAAVLDGRADWAALNADAGAAEADRVLPGRIAGPGPRFLEIGLGVAVRAGDPAGVLPRLGLAPADPG